MLIIATGRLFRLWQVFIGDNARVKALAWLLKLWDNPVGCQDICTCRDICTCGMATYDWAAQSPNVQQPLAEGWLLQASSKALQLGLVLVSSINLQDLRSPDLAVHPWCKHHMFENLRQLTSGSTLDVAKTPWSVKSWRRQLYKLQLSWRDCNCHSHRMVLLSRT